IRHFCDERALNSLYFLHDTSPGFLRTPLSLGKAAKHAIPDPPAPRPPEHPAYGPVHRNGARPVQGLLERLALALGILVPPLPGAGQLGTTSAKFLVYSAAFNVVLK